MASYQTGTLDFLSLFSNFMNVVDYELMVHEEILQFHVSLARLEEMTAMEVNPVRTLILLVAMAGAGAAGFGYGRWYAKPVGALAGPAAAERKPLYWVDPMHPWYRSDKPGTAPDCGMALVPVYRAAKSVANTKPRRTARAPCEVSPEKQQLIGVEYRHRCEYTRADATPFAPSARVDAGRNARVAKVQTQAGGLDRPGLRRTSPAIR